MTRPCHFSNRNRCVLFGGLTAAAAILALSPATSLPRLQTFISFRHTGHTWTTGIRNGSAKCTKGSQSGFYQRERLSDLYVGMFWIILFFCDGRYWACYHTTFEGDADSTANPPWEWCNTNRSLTAAQRKAERAYNDSKFGGFMALLVSTVITLILYIMFDKYRRERGVSREQTAAEQGTAGAQESSGQQTPTHTRTAHDNCQDTARTQESRGQQTSTI
ncbi:hypothetical protein AOLI_G00202100 [Acnodon oligacanthus]